MDDAELVDRPLYREKLAKYNSTEFIKVLTGARRVGKSALMRLAVRGLRKRGVPEANIIYINFEFMRYDAVRDYHSLYELLRSKMPSGRRKGTVYIFLDELQQVAGWERAVSALKAEFDVDIYITGSNAWMLSSEFATLLSGRYVEIEVFPLSFKEYLSFTSSGKTTAGKIPPGQTLTVEQKFSRYLKYGGFPALRTLPQEDEAVNNALQGIYNTVIVKDILTRHPLRDIKLLEQLIRFLAQNTGNIISPNKIASYWNSSGALKQNESVKAATVSQYLDLMEQAFIVYSCNRFDIKGKELLKTLAKYYILDTGLRNMLLGYSGSDTGAVLETVVYFELLRRGWKVFTGRQGEAEVDFVAVKQEETRYIQVTETMLGEETRNRELKPLQAIKDNYEKTVLSMDRSFATDYNGIRQRNIIDWLLED
jgi:predicted AAA+ superfamily ATPase